MKILFVCLGNICRSPMAEAVMRKKLGDAGLSEAVTLDSAATGDWYTGSSPHQGTRHKLDSNGVSYEGIIARRITEADLESADYIIGMDHSNIKNIQQLCTDAHKNKVYLLSEFVEDAQWDEMPDPWYTGDFDLTYEQVCEGCEGLLRHIRETM